METKNWKWFLYKDIFTIKKGKRLTKADMEDGEIPYIGATDSNNGITARISNNAHLHKANTISVSYNGSIAEAFYQPNKYWATDDVNVLYPNFELTKNIAIFLITIINKEKYRFNYGRKWDKELMEQSEIKLPINERGNPDWQWIENFVKEKLIPELPLKAKSVWLNLFDETPLSNERLQLNTKNWKWFEVRKLFADINIGKSYDLNALTADKYGVNYISRTVTNNGLEYKVDASNLIIEQGNCINIVMVGVPATAFFQKDDFVCSQNLLILRSANINIYTAMFINAIIEKEKYRFSYGKTLTKTFFENHKIKLPATADGTPDWQFMEDYIKGLPYSGCL